MAAPGSAPNDLARAIQELLAELPARVRGSRERLEEQTVGSLRSLVRELGLVTRDDFDELELRVAQLEHRLRLVESESDSTSLPPRG